MTTRDLVRAITKWSGKEYLECAEEMGLNRQKWYRRLSGAMTVDEFLELLGVCGLGIGIIKDGEVWEPRAPHGALRASSKGKRYSTAASRPLAYDGKRELFVDRTGDYFIADYQLGKVEATDYDGAMRFRRFCE